MSSMRMKSSSALCRRYKCFFYICGLILGVQVFLGYSFYTMNQVEISKIQSWKEKVDQKLELITTTSPKTVMEHHNQLKPKILTKEDVQKLLPAIPKNINIKKDIQLGFDLLHNNKCNMTSKEAISAMGRVKTEACKQELTDVVCKTQQGKLYPESLPRLCPLKGEYAKGKYLGCFKDSQKDRDLQFNIEFPNDNLPQKCIEFCLIGGYQYAGLQYKQECWCGNQYGKHGNLSETSCSSKCPGDHTQKCGGFNSQAIYTTGLPDKKSIPNEVVLNEDSVKTLTPVRIVFVLTVNGRAVRQVHRLINSLYHPNHFFFIHVDSRSVYMYRELEKLSREMPNVRLAQERFATIWGGASLLQAHFSFIKALLAMTDWPWDYYINLSESDYPIKRVDELTWFLTKYRGNNFLKSNGRETPTFIKKQGLDQVFYECDNHLWRLGKRELPLGVRIDGGSDWIGLYRDFCEYSVTSLDPLVTGLSQLYKYTLLPVESFFHVLLLNSVFCEKWVDNNLHLTNWKRKLGCKCQHKAQVDWCGCSPNVLKQQDLDRILAHKGKTVYFARKFEVIISQEIINSIDSYLGMDISDIPALTYYWQNEYHNQDPRDKKTDLYLTYMYSLIRRTREQLHTAKSSCDLSNIKILQSHILNVGDEFHRYVIQYNVTLPGRSIPVTMETQYGMKTFYRLIDPKAGPIGRLQNLQVGTDFDPKELIFRNYAGIIGPYSEVQLRHVWGYGPAATMTLAWIDPAGVIALYKDIPVAQESLIEMHNPKLKTPLRPGEWTVKILYIRKVCAEVKFYVLPLSTIEGMAMSQDDVFRIHNGPEGGYSVTDYSEFANNLGIVNTGELEFKVAESGAKTGGMLESWVDEVTSKRWTVQTSCSVIDFGSVCPSLDICRDTRWSSLSPDPKSEITIYRQRS